MPLEDYLPFDPYGRESDTQDDIDIIFDAMGWDNWIDAFHDIEAENNSEYSRPARYNTAEEALIDAYERGMLAFTRLVYLENEDKYSIYVEYKE